MLLCLSGLVLLCSCTEKPESSSSAAPANVFVSYERPDSPFAECGGYTAESEYSVPVYFASDTGVTDFAILDLSDPDVDEDGNLSYGTVTEIFFIKSMGKDQYVSAELVFMGSIPNNGFRYTDSDGTVKVFTVSQSGYDGSLVVNVLEQP